MRGAVFDADLRLRDFVSPEGPQPEEELDFFFLIPPDDGALFFELFLRGFDFGVEDDFDELLRFFGAPDDLDFLLRFDPDLFFALPLEPPGPHFEERDLLFFEPPLEDFLREDFLLGLDLPRDFSFESPPLDDLPEPGSPGMTGQQSEQSPPLPPFFSPLELLPLDPPPSPQPSPPLLVVFFLFELEGAELFFCGFAFFGVEAFLARRAAGLGFLTGSHDASNR